jgi:DNA ligase-1
MARRSDKLAAMPAPLLDFAAANDAAAGTTKKLAKTAILADYLRNLTDDDDLRRAVRYAAGRPFPATAERNLNVGGATFADVAEPLLGLNPAQYHDLVVRSGEVGEALSIAWDRRSRKGQSPAAPPRILPPLTLRDVAATFDDLANTGNGERKRAILAELFNRCAERREAAYVAKVIFGDLRTGVQDGVLEAAVAAAFDRPLAAVRRALLMVGDLDAVAVLARHDQLATAAFALFHPIQFMLATPQESAEVAAATLAGRSFVAEDKLDGIRAQVHKDGDRIAIYTRTMDRADESFPDVVAAVRQLPGAFLLDGEIVPYRNGVVLPFANIQKRLGRKVLTAKILRDHPAVFIAFDVLYRDGALLMDEPWTVRHAALDALVTPPATGDHVPAAAGTPVRLVPASVTTAADIDAAFAKSRQARNEGLVLKDPDSPYVPGRRGKQWLKLKTHLPTFDCVVTAAEYGHGKRRDSLSDYTFAVWDRDPAEGDARLVNIGKAFSGVTDAEIARLTELFLGISTGQVGRVHAVRPQVVLEIAADQIQKSGRHASGYALRFPRVKRVRWDKRPEDADTVARVAEVYDSDHNTARGGGSPENIPEPTLFDGM